MSSALSPLEPLPAQKVFVGKHGLQKLDSYKGCAPDWYWHVFPKNLLRPGRSNIDHQRLEELALMNGFDDRKLLNQICSDVRSGANIGCKGAFREASFSENASSSLEFGEQVSDAISDWIVKGYAYGPVDKEDLPASAKINGIMCRPKPNGSVRIILNLSAPVGYSVNEGIDEREFPATMSSTVKWLRVLHLAGKSCWICKVDWSDAYKHVTVRAQDLDLQWFQWLGKYFCELCLIFGSKSSVGLYDRLAKLVIFIVCKEAGMPPGMVCQHLDDCAAAGPRDSPLLEIFDATFFRVAEELGIRLAPRDNPEKAFGPSTKGIVFGVEYNTIDWTWAVPAEKLSRILHTIQTALRSHSITQGDLMSLSGKIINVRPLVPQGKFHIDHILRAAAQSDNKAEIVCVEGPLFRQLEFWFVMLRSCSNRVAIPNPDLQLPVWALDFYTDAAGGGLDQHGLRCGRGVGAVGSSWWAYIPWSRTICIGPTLQDGTRLNRKMSALELVGPLLVVSAGFNVCKGMPVRVWVDNSGSVAIWRKGYSTSCRLCSTIVKAIGTVAAGIGCRLDVTKILRCSTPEADMADALSKGAFQRFWDLNNRESLSLGLEPAWVPPQLSAWLEHPREDDALGDRILAEIGRRMHLLQDC